MRGKIYLAALGVVGAILYGGHQLLERGAERTNFYRYESLYGVAAKGGPEFYTNRDSFVENNPDKNPFSISFVDNYGRIITVARPSQAFKEKEFVIMYSAGKSVGMRCAPNDISKAIDYAQLTDEFVAGEKADMNTLERVVAGFGECR